MRFDGRTTLGDIFARVPATARMPLVTWRGRMSKTEVRQLDSAARGIWPEVGALDWRGCDGPEVMDPSSRSLPKSSKVANSTRGWSGFSVVKLRKLKAMVRG